MLSQKVYKKVLRLTMSSLDLPNSNKMHFSFIVDKNKIVSFGWNNGWKTHPMAAHYGHRFNAIHSELAAIKNFPYPLRELKNYNLVNIRVKKDLSLGHAMPCSFCQKMLESFEISGVYYSGRNGELLSFC